MGRGHGSEQEQNVPGAADGRLAWIETRVANAMRAKQEKLKALWAGQSRELLLDFLDTPNARRIIFCHGPKGIEAIATPPPFFKKNT